MKFEDHFSTQAAVYARFRPRYPAELYAFLADQAPERRLAWDSATGSGQAAVGLANHFAQVIATDASQEQIRQAEPNARVAYRVEPAEATSLEPGSVDLVTAATAAHWFDLDRFYEEVHRVSKTGGVIALWTYHRPRIDPAVDALTVHFEMEILDGYWPERIHFLREQYQTLPFPFERLPAPEFNMRAEWNLTQFAGFLESWSAVQRYEKQRGHSPLKAHWEAFAAAWGDPGTQRIVDWKLHLLLGRIGPTSRDVL